MDAPWRTPGAEPSDFFNYGMDVRKWKDYATRVQQYRLEYRMQHKIATYDGEQGDLLDPDLPPELAAALAVERRQMQVLSCGGVLQIHVYIKCKCTKSRGCGAGPAGCSSTPLLSSTGPGAKTFLEASSAYSSTARTSAGTEAVHWTATSSYAGSWCRAAKFCAPTCSRLGTATI